MILSRDNLTAELSQSSPTRHWVVDVFDQLPSTNDFLRERDLAERAGVIELCATDWQTAGHGRRGKNWSSQRGNVTFTVRQRIKRPAGDLLGLSLVTGIAVSTVLRERLGVQAELKWPNDVLVDGKKLGGLLIELLTVPGDSKSTDVVTGIGLNVHHQREFDQLGIGATSLEKLGRSPELDRHELIAAIAESVASLYVEFETSGWSVFEPRWRSVDALFGRAVTVSGGSMLTGTACGVSASGALLVDTGAETTSVVAGEVSVRPV